MLKSKVSSSNFEWSQIFEVPIIIIIILIITMMTSRCIGRKTEARGGNGEIPAAALGDGMMGGGTPDYFDDF